MHLMQYVHRISLTFGCAFIKLVKKYPIIFFNLSFFLEKKKRKENSFNPFNTCLIF